MDAKIKAVGKLTQVAEKRRDQVGQQLESMRQQSQHLELQLSQLSQLRTYQSGELQQKTTVTSANLMNLNMVDQMLHKMLVHHRHEHAVMEAQCSSVQKDLEHKHARVKGLEQVMDRWQAKQKYEKARKEQKMIEDIINSRIRKRVL